MYILCGTYLFLALVGILLIVFFLDTYSRKTIGEDSKSENNVDKCTKKKKFEVEIKLIKSTLAHLGKRNQLLVIPITCWLGFAQSFIGGDFTRSFVSCTKGVDYVGLVMISFGVKTKFSFIFKIKI